MKLISIGIGAIVFALLNAEVSRNVSEYQINATYYCFIVASEIDHRLKCRNENDGFGFLLVRGMHQNGTFKKETK